MTAEASRHPGLNLGSAHREAHDAAEVAVFGFWVYLMSDLVLFGLLFATYVVMLGATAGGPGPKDLFDLKSAGTETFVLLTSSFTFGMASLALKYGRNRLRLLFWLGLTLVLGLIFLGFEIHDFMSMVEKGGVPSRSGFLSAFFALVPTHGLHVTAGSIWIVIMMIQVAVFGIGYTGQDANPAPGLVLALPRYRLGRDLFGRLSRGVGAMSEGQELRSYFIGFGLALVLSAVPFAAVAWGGLAVATTLWLIASFALVQIVVHFRFFLHIDLGRQKREDLWLILFSVLLFTLMAGGTIWILFDLHMRMM